MIAWWCKWMFHAMHNLTVRRNREISYGDLDNLPEYLRISPPAQINYVDARKAGALLKHLPVRNRRTMELLIDGANPLEISNETQTPITTVINIIEQSRVWLSDGGCYLYVGT